MNMAGHKEGARCIVVPAKCGDGVLDQMIGKVVTISNPMPNGRSCGIDWAISPTLEAIIPSLVSRHIELHELAMIERLTQCVLQPLPDEGDIAKQDAEHAVDDAVRWSVKPIKIVEKTRG
jgi:hypothetical protein